MRINNNLMALNAHRQLAANQTNIEKSIEKLSSGLRINRASDDAAGLSISEKMRGQIRGLNQAARNAQDGISLIQTAEGALNETHAILQRMRELVVQAGNLGTQEAEDLQAIQDELDQLSLEIDGIAGRTEFNGKKLLDGSFNGTFQIGANAGQQLNLQIASMDAVGLSLATIDNTDPDNPVVTSAFDVTDAAFDFDEAIGIVDQAIQDVSAERSNLGAVQNRLEHTIANLTNAAENLQAAESRIRDVDMAQEMMAFTKNQILQQASTAMLAQANMAPQGVLQLLG